MEQYKIKLRLGNSLKLCEKAKLGLERFPKPYLYVINCIREKTS